MLIRAEFATHCDDPEDADRETRRTCLDDFQERRFAFAESGGRDECNGRYRNKDIDGAGDHQAAKEHFRKYPARCLAFLGHVDRILEADHGEEGKRRRRDDGPKDAAIAARLESPYSETSPCPPAIAQKPMPIIIRRPVSSTVVSSTLSLTLSPTPQLR